MKTSPQIRLYLSPDGINDIEVLYARGERATAWLFYERLMPLLQELDDASRKLGSGLVSASDNPPSKTPIN